MEDEKKDSTESSTAETQVVSEETKEEEVIAEEPVVEEVEDKDSGLKARLAQLEDEKRYLQGTLDRVLAQPQQQYHPQEAVQQEEDFQDPAVKRAVQKALQEQQRLTAGMVGGLYDELDSLRMTSSPNKDLYKKHEVEVEETRNRAARENRWLKREEALALVMSKRGYKMDEEKPRTKVVKQPQKPAGNITPGSGKTVEKGKPKSLAEKLKGVSF